MGWNGKQYFNNLCDKADINDGDGDGDDNTVLSA